MKLFGGKKQRRNTKKRTMTNKRKRNNRTKRGGFRYSQNSVKKNRFSKSRNSSASAYTNSILSQSSIS